MHIQQVNVTPELASGWLSQSNNSNRSLSHHTVSKYASDMAAGRWVATHQNAIAFYEDGDLADGQHRLAAVCKSGASVNMVVAYGLPRSAATAIDQGRARKMSDVMAISGAIEGGKYASATVAMMNIIRRAEGRTNGVATPFEMERAIRRMSDGIDFSHSVTTRAKGRLMSAPARAAFCAAYYAIGERAVAGFADVFVTGMPTSPRDETVIVYRNRILTEHGGLGGAGKRETFYKMGLRFLRAYSECRIVKVARVGDELAYRTGAFDD